MLADDEIDRVNKRLDEAQGSAPEVETLKSYLAQAKEEAKANKAAADKAAAELKAEQVARRQHEERVAEVEQELKDTIRKCEALEENTMAEAVELAKALQEAKEARTESRSAREEIQQAEQIAADNVVNIKAILHAEKLYTRGSSIQGLKEKALASPNSQPQLSPSSSGSPPPAPRFPAPATSTSPLGSPPLASYHRAIALLLSLRSMSPQPRAYSRSGPPKPVRGPPGLAPSCQRLAPGTLASRRSGAPPPPLAEAPAPPASSHRPAEH
nr:atherin-like [Aegilops tauschii subsp. strangulata]